MFYFVGRSEIDGIMSDLIILSATKKKYRVVPAVAGNVHIFRTCLEQCDNNE